jgi:hypothetical protein
VLTLKVTIYLGGENEQALLAFPLTGYLQIVQ